MKRDLKTEINGSAYQTPHKKSLDYKAITSKAQKQLA
jgi:hypothetical protein